MNPHNESTQTNRLLQAALFITMAVGAIMVVAPDLTMQFFGLMIYQEPGRMLSWSEEAQQYIKLAHAVMGSIMLGWAVLMLLAARFPNQQTRDSVVKAMSLSLLVWYIPDTLASLLYGFWQNALFNTGFLLMLMVPLYLRGSATQSASPRHSG